MLYSWLIKRSPLPCPQFATLPVRPVKYWTQSVGALYSASQGICCSRTLYILVEERSAWVKVIVIASVDKVSKSSLSWQMLSLTLFTVNVQVFAVVGRYPVG